MNAILGVPLGFLIALCYRLCHSYGWAILLFTLITKLLLTPVSVWVHKNGIRMIRVQPDINRIKARFVGDADRIAEEQAALYKQEKYNPFAGIIPMVIQLILLVGMIYVIQRPLTYVLRLPAETLAAIEGLTVSLTGAEAGASTIQLSVIEAVRDAQYQPAFAALAVPGTDMTEVIASIVGFKTWFFVVDVLWIPSARRGLMILVPVLAGLSALLLSLTQNRQNVLQAEQGKTAQIATSALTVFLSLYLGWFVPVGIALYWIGSNLYAIAQQAVLNWAINPRKYIDFDALEQSRAELAEIQKIGDANRDKETIRREKEDYKRFFSIANKHLVFYSERSGFYKYFEGVIDYLLQHSNVSIHYVTSDPQDVIFRKAEKNPQIKPYYIGEKKLITLMMKMDADIVVMTMPDLNSFHIKRSYVRKDIEYVYIFHAMLVGMRTLREGAVDHYDTLLCSGPEQVREIRAIERETGAAEKKLVPCGYSLIDTLAREYERMPAPKGDVRRILIAPSWQENNILESCLIPLLTQLLPAGYDITVRAHPQYERRFPTRYAQIQQECEQFIGDRFRFEADFSSNETVYTADLLVTDWSAIGFEYALATRKPALYIDTPMKVVNEALRVAEDGGEPPLDIRLRNVVGKSMTLDEVSSQTLETVEALLAQRDAYGEAIDRVRAQELFNFGHSAEHEGQYLLSALVARQQQPERIEAS